MELSTDVLWLENFLSAPLRNPSRRIHLSRIPLKLCGTEVRKTPHLSNVGFQVGFLSSQAITTWSRWGGNEVRGFLSVDG